MSFAGSFAGSSYTREISRANSRPFLHFRHDRRTIASLSLSLNRVTRFSQPRVLEEIRRLDRVLSARTTSAEIRITWNICRWIVFRSRCDDTRVISICPRKTSPLPPEPRARASLRAESPPRENVEFSRRSAIRRGHTGGCRLHYQCLANH